MRSFAASPEEKVVVDNELLKMKDAQAQLESSGFQQLNELRRSYDLHKARANAPFSGTGYNPLPPTGQVTVSEKIWLKPAGSPERGSMRESTTTLMGPGGTQNIVHVDREGSAELYCIKKFVFTGPDGKKLDPQKIMIARSFAKSAADFLAVHLP
jgi:hypothetical protein